MYSYKTLWRHWSSYRHLKQDKTFSILKKLIFINKTFIKYIRVSHMQYINMNPGGFMLPQCKL